MYQERESSVYITNKIQKIKASIHSFMYQYQVPGHYTCTVQYQARPDLYRYRTLEFLPVPQYLWYLALAWYCTVPVKTNSIFFQLFFCIFGSLKKLAVVPRSSQRS